MLQVNRGDLVWLKPGINALKELGKNIQSIERPYIVISNNKNNRYSPTVQLAAVTKQMNKGCYPMHVVINKDNYKCLMHDSVVLLEQVITVNKELIQRKSISLNEEDIKKINRAIFIQMIDDEMNVSEVM